jgi:hypothetical protein
MLRLLSTLTVHLFGTREFFAEEKGSARLLPFCFSRQLFCRQQKDEGLFVSPELVSQPSVSIFFELRAEGF